MIKFIISRDSPTSKDPRNSYYRTWRRRSSQDSSYCINKIFTLTFPSASSNIAKMYKVSLSSVSQFQLPVQFLYARISSFTPGCTSFKPDCTAQILLRGSSICRKILLLNKSVKKFSILFLFPFHIHFRLSYNLL